MGKGAPSAPAPPDPYKTASAQGEANIQTAVANTALQNANVYNPYGQTTFQQTGTQQVTMPDGTVQSLPTYSEYQQLGGDAQVLFDQQNALAEGMNGLAFGAMNNLQDTLNNPITQDQFAKIQSSVGATPGLQSSYGSSLPVQSGYDNGGSITRGYDTGPALAFGYNPGGGIQSDVGYTNANTNSPTAFGGTQAGVQYYQGQDFNKARDDATNAALARLAPSMAQQQESLNASLANQGTAQGSAAWNAAQLSQAQAQNDLRLGAVSTGDAEQQALFGQSATANQLFNSAQAQDYGQQQGRGQFAQAGIAANNAAIGQNNAAALAAASFHNAAQGQQNAQNAAQAAFLNSSVGQQNQQNAALAAFSNAAQAQANSQNANAASFANMAQAQDYSQQAQLAGFYNATQNQDYQNRLSAGAFNNQASQQQLAQLSALQNQQINQISALRSGNQVAGIPGAPGYQGGTVDQTPLSSDVYSSASLAEQQYQSQLQASAANQAAMGSALGGIFGGIGRKSDRRLKSDVSPVARARNGLTIYRYRLAGQDGWELGFMADEVALIHPEAVWTDPADGWARVDYDRAVA